MSLIKHVYDWLIYYCTTKCITSWWVSEPLEDVLKTSVIYCVDETCNAFVLLLNLFSIDSSTFSTNIAWMIQLIYHRVSTYSNQRQLTCGLQLLLIVRLLKSKWLSIFWRFPHFYQLRGSEIPSRIDVRLVLWTFVKRIKEQAGQFGIYRIGIQEAKGSSARGLINRKSQRWQKEQMSTFRRVETSGRLEELSH